MFVNGWPKGDFISRIFEAAPECPENLSLPILAREPHKEVCPRKPERLEEKDKGWQSVKSETPGQSVGSETLKHGIVKLGR